MNPEGTKVLIVEDEMIIALNISNVLESAGYRVTGTAITMQEAMRLVDAEPPEVILMDIILDGKVDGIRAAREIGSKYGIPIVFMSGNADDLTIREAQETNPLGFLEKPVIEEDMLALLARVPKK